MPRRFFLVSESEPKSEPESGSESESESESESALCPLPSAL